MKKILLLSVALFLSIIAPAHALTGGFSPANSMASTTGNYTVSWSEPWADTAYYQGMPLFKLTEEKLNSGIAPVLVTLPAWNASSVSFTNKAPGEYLYSYTRRSCSASGCFYYPMWGTKLLVAVGPSAQVITTPVESATAVGSTPYTTSVSDRGEAVISIPIAVRPGINGMQPHLSINYNSSGTTKNTMNQSAYGWLGYGWSLGGISSIQRCTTGLYDVNNFFISPSAPVHVNQYMRPRLKYDNTDRICLDGELLVLVSGNNLQVGAQYRTYTESFKLITIESDLQGGFYFRVGNPDGGAAIYGYQTNSRIQKITTPGGSQKTPYFQWFVDSEYNSLDNSVTYEYGAKDESFSYQSNKTRAYPISIKWSGGEVGLNYMSVTHSQFFSIEDDGPTAGIDRYRYFFDGGEQLSSISVTTYYTRTYTIGAVNQGNDIGYHGLKVGFVQECNPSLVNGNFEGGTLTKNCLPPITFNWESTNINPPYQQAAGYSYDLAHINKVTDSLGATTEFSYIEMGDKEDLNTHSAFIPYIQTNFTESPFPVPSAGTPAVDQLDHVVDVVVTAVKRSTGLSSTDVHTTSYRYRGHTFRNHVGLANYGFPAVRIKDETTGITTYKQFDVSGAPQNLSVKLGAVYQYKGVDGAYDPVTAAANLTTNNLISKTEIYNSVIPITYANNVQTFLPVVTQNSSLTYENGNLIGATVKANEYTIANNLMTQIKTTVTTGSEIDSSSITPTVTWGKNALYRLTNSSTKNTQVTTTTLASAMSVNWSMGNTYDVDWRIGYTTAKQTNFYNGGIAGGYTDAKTQRTEYIVKPYSTAMQTIKRFPNDTENWLNTDYVYDDKGRQTSVTISGANVASRTTTSTYITPVNYTSTTTAYPGSVINALGHTITNSDFDPRFDKPQSIADVNGLVSTQTFDSVGRISTSVDVNGVINSTSYKSCATTSCGAVAGQLQSVVPVYMKETLSSANPQVREYYDSLGRVIRTEKQGFIATDWIRTDTQYDNLGRVYKTSLPYKVGLTPYYVTNTYDKFNRLIRIDKPDGGYITTSYDTAAGSDGYQQLRTITTENIFNKNGAFIGAQQKIAYTNSASQLTKVIDSAATTTYEYDALGNVVKTTVNGGGDGSTVTTATYDNAGNRISITDPNAGTITSRYTALGELRWMQDNKGNTTNYTYDLLGRILTRVSADGTSNWFYDPVGAKGNLWYTTNNNGYTQTYFYQDPNRAARLSRIETTIAVPDLATKTYTSSFTYDIYGRAQKTISPSGFATTQNYNAQGYPSGIGRGDNLYALQSTQQIGAFGIEQEQLADNSTSLHGYDPKSGRLNSIRTIAYNYAKIQELTYQWRSNGSLDNRTDSKSGISIMDTFHYDGLDRLIATVTTSNGSYQRTLMQTYNNLGNIIANTSTVSTDAQVTGYQYTSGKPHATNGVTINGIYNQLYYDQNGAITNYDAPGTAQDKVIAYNAANQPTNITLGASLTDPNPVARDEFRYTPDGARYYKKSTYKEGANLRVEKTIYIGNYETTYYDTFSTFKQIEKSQVGSSLLHILNTPYSGAAVESIEVLHRDHLGSVNAVTQGSTIIANLAFEPFGSRRAANTLLTNIGTTELASLLSSAGTRNSQDFTGHENLDRTGLIHMNGRVYDPQLARFLSPDPLVQAPTDSQSWNRYSYVANNPLRYTDPSGYVTRCAVEGCEIIIEQEEEVGCSSDNCVLVIGQSDNGGQKENTLIIVHSDDGGQKVDKSGLDNIGSGSGGFKPPPPGSGALIRTGATVGFGTGVIAAVACDALTELDCVVNNAGIVETSTNAGAAIGAFASNMLSANEKETGNAKSVDRPQGVPKSWNQTPGKKDGHTKFVNPENSHDYVRVKPDGTITQVRDGKAFDVDGNSVDLKSPSAHGITSDMFNFTE